MTLFLHKQIQKWHFLYCVLPLIEHKFYPMNNHHFQEDFDTVFGDIDQDDNVEEFLPLN